jgi:mercuric ion binding protein
MRKFLATLSVLFFLLAQIAAPLAGELKTITLDVDKMTCNMCPITVKKALRKIDGVTEVVAKYEGEGNGWAKVTYDPSKADVDDLTFATEEAGYPSRLKP